MGTRTSDLVCRLVVGIAVFCVAVVLPLAAMADIDVSGAACATLPDCEDVNPCTADTCVDGSCSNERNPGLEGIECELDRLEDVDVCGAELLHVKFRAALTKKAAKARKLARKAAEATKAEKFTKLVTRAGKTLQAIMKKATKFAGRNKMTNDCKTTVEQHMEIILRLLSELRPMQRPAGANRRGSGRVACLHRRIASV